MQEEIWKYQMGRRRKSHPPGQCCSPGPDCAVRSQHMPVPAPGTVPGPGLSCACGLHSPRALPLSQVCSSHRLQLKPCCYTGVCMRIKKTQKGAGNRGTEPTPPSQDEPLIFYLFFVCVCLHHFILSPPPSLPPSKTLTH